ncbi:MAG: 6-phosphofructokinase [Candidatus Eremiobacteraeota bacterium]|nr:6-phosphofructokinase [Candidatus Eremiobacteraeota bacterium]
MAKDALGILVGGGPAPGINAVIAAATMEAARNGLRTIGILDGYQHLVRGDVSQVVELSPEGVARIQTTGGSILRTSRTNPAKDEKSLQNCVDALERLGVRYLLAIGGDDTTYGASRIAALTNGQLGVVTVPKTIDNDLPLPDDAPTFGFETARAVATAVVTSLIEDARTAQRWYLVVSMGRKSGSLAVGMCSSAGAALAVIPEEFQSDELQLEPVVDTIVGAIIKRKAAGYNHGVAVIAEGIAEHLAPDALSGLRGVSKDAYGHVRLADVPLGTVLRDAVRRRCSDLGVSTTVLTKDIGYELRCAQPVAFDVEYARSLGYGAFRYLLSGESGALIALSRGDAVPLRLQDIVDPKTGRIRVRSVNVKSAAYQIARRYMVHLDAEDFREPQLSRLAAQTKFTPAQFREAFEGLISEPAVAAT